MAKTSKPVAPVAPQPPYIKRAHLRNVPPLRDVKVDFKPGLNIIIGKNGSGKTNFMKLLSELANPFRKNYEGLGSELKIGGDYEIDILFNKQTNNKIADSAFYTELSNERTPLLAVVKDAVETNTAEIVLDAIADVKRLKMVYFLVSIWHGIPNARIPILDESTDFVLPKTGPAIITNPLFYKRNVPSRIIEAFFNTINTAYYKSSLFNQSIEDIDIDAVHKVVAGSIDMHLKRLNNYLNEYSPLQGIQRSGQFQIYRNGANDEIIIKGLILEYKIGDEWLPFGALSDGTKRMLYMIGELTTLTTSIWKKEQRKIDLVIVDKILLVEEPELGIHPDQLQLLLQLIREVSKEHQVIMTTHSPQTLDMLSAQELDRITICEFIPGKGTQMRKLSPAKKNKAKAYLRDSGFLSEFWRFSNLEAPD